MKEKHNAISVRLPVDLHLQLREVAAANERTLAQETRRIIALHFQENGGQSEAAA